MQNLVDINVGLLFAISLLIVSTNTWSHGGRLNSEGCHNDKAASEYHCHTSMSNPKESKSTGYNRDNWSFNSSASPVSNSAFGWYTNINGSATDVDHVVALKDAFMSGGSDWNSSQKRTFANDPFNHVAAVPYVNRTLKNAYVPRIKGGENIADLRETEGNQYPVSKELV